MVDLAEWIQQDKIGQTWSAEIGQTYQEFYERLTVGGPLTVKIGKGGLSFYKNAKSASVFVCHFNAEPRKGQWEVGFADFRYDALRDHLDVDQTVQALQSAALPDLKVKVNKLWCSLHFPIDSSPQVADLFVKHIIRKL